MRKALVFIMLFYCFKQIAADMFMAICFQNNKIADVDFVVVGMPREYADDFIIFLCSTLTKIIRMDTKTYGVKKEANM